MMRAKKSDLGHATNSMLALIRARREDEKLFITEFLELMDILSTTFYTTVGEALIAYGFAEIETNPRERVVYIKLTEKGRRFA